MTNDGIKRTELAEFLCDESASGLSSRPIKCSSNGYRKFHSLRHSLAMNLLHHGADRSVIALWLGHESVETTSIYLQADMQLKEQALAKTTAAQAPATHYRPSDRVLAFPKGL